MAETATASTGRGEGQGEGRPPLSPPAPSWRMPLWSNLLSFALIAWIAGRCLAIALEVRGARTVALLAIPPWPVYAAALAVALGLGGLTVAARLRRTAPDARVYRLLPIAAVLVMGVHVFVLPPYSLPYGAERIITSQLAMLQDDLQPDADGRLPTAPERIVEAAWRPPFLRDGEPMAAWNVVVRTDCAGPVEELPAGVEAGTLFYCASPDRLKTWITAVGLGNTLAGKPALVRWEGRPAVAAVELEAASAVPTSEREQTGGDEPQLP